MKLPRFDPPALVDDLTTEAERAGWSREIERMFERGIAEVERYPGVQSQFYNPLKTDTSPDFAEKLIDWIGFPKLVRDAYPDDRVKAWQMADAGLEAPRDLQDEYLEWHVVNRNGQITRVCFTCEGPDYWSFLAATNTQKLLALYNARVDPAFEGKVRLQDLVKGGAYDPYNRWNTEHGAVHLIQPNNSLFAEVMIAAQATVRRQKGGKELSDSDQLIMCADYGERGRSSDPRIGAEVNALARMGYAITLQNPVGLYITSWSDVGWTKPDGSPVGDYWTCARGARSPGPGKPARALHLVYEVPPGLGFVVGDIRINGEPIEYGGQLAEHIRVGLTGVACRKGSFNNPTLPCGPPAGKALEKLLPYPTRKKTPAGASLPTGLGLT